MHEYRLDLRMTDERGKLLGETTIRSERLREGPVPWLPDMPVRMNEIGGIYIQNTMLRDQQEVELWDGGPRVHMHIEEIFQKAENDPGRLKGKVCHNCQLWDRAEGVRQFSLQTHNYANGTLSKIEEINRAIATKNKLQPLTPTIVGYCPMHQKLCAETSLACADHYAPRAWPARVKNWWVRMFR